MIRLFMLFFALTAVVGLKATSALAANAHFVEDPTCSATSTTLTCSGKVAGLGNGPIYVVVDAETGCINNGQNKPQGHQQFVSGPFFASNGQFTFGPGTGNTVTAGPATCPPGQTAYISTTGVLVNVYECSSGAPTFNRKGQQTNSTCTLVASETATIV